MAYRTQCGSRVTFLGCCRILDSIHQIHAYMRDLLRLVRSWVTFTSRLESPWLILMDLHQIFRFLDSCPNQQETRMILFSNVFKKSDLLVEPDCLNRIFLVPPTGLLVFQVISDVHPWDTLEQRAHRRHMADKKSGQDMLFWVPVTFRCFDRGVCGACGKCHFIAFCFNPGSRWLVAGRNSMNNIV